MSEILAHPAPPMALSDLRPDASTGFRDRIGRELSGGFYPAPHRYHLYLSLGCPRSLRVSITLDLLGLGSSVGTTVLPPPGAAGAGDAFASLRAAYQASRHHYDGPLETPALVDRWSGRVVSNHTPAILDDLAVRFAAPDGAGQPRLRPTALAADIDALRELLDADSSRSALPDLLERRLARSRYVLGETLTSADVDVWVALVHPGTGAERPGAGHERLRAYLRGLGAQPAFRVPPPADGGPEQGARGLRPPGREAAADRDRSAVPAGQACVRPALAS